MKRLFHLLSFILTLMIFAGCGTEDYVATLGQIEGRVIDANTNQPIQGCQVIISNGHGTTHTDADGYYSFMDVEPGNVSLTFKARDYESLTRVYAVTAGRPVKANISLNPLNIANDPYTDKTILDFGNATGVMNLVVKNPTSSSISYTVSSSAGWITANPERGTVISGGESTISVSVNRDGLSSGSYDEILTIETSRSSKIEIQVLVDKGSISRPTVNTLSVTQSETNPTSVIARGAVTNLGSSKVLRHGFCYRINEDPTIEENDGITNYGDLTSPENFTNELQSLQYGKEYHIRAYATNEVGTSYGETKMITLYKQEFAEVATGAISDIKSTSATLSGSIVGGSSNAFSKLGFCYGTTPACSNSTISDPTISGTTFRLTLTNLKPDTEYYYKAYGTDSRGTIYGNVKSFKTAKDAASEGAITLVTTDATNIGTNSATLNGGLALSGNAKVKEYGFFYGTTSYPSIKSVVTSFSSATTLNSTTFQTNLKDLKENTKYYFQSYAIDGYGSVVRGSIQSFTTKITPTVKITSAHWYRDPSSSNKHILKADATLYPQGNLVMEAGFINDSNSTPWSFNTKCEVINNTISTNQIINFAYSVFYVKAYMVLSNGITIYSDTIKLVEEAAN